MPAEVDLAQAHWLAAVPMPLRPLLRVEQVGPGEVTVTLEPQPWMGSTIAAAALLADDALGLAVGGTMPLGTLAVSAELTIDVVGPVPERPVALVARAVARYVDAEGGVGTGMIADDSGREFALVTLRSLRSRTLDPDQHSGRGESATFVPPAGTEPLSAVPGLANGSDVVHGGVTAIAGLAAAARALEPLTVVGARIFYVRPIPADERELEVETTVIHAGRRAGMAQVEVGPAADGSVAAWLTVSAIGKTSASNQGGTDE